MRASDIVKGKDPALKPKEKADRPLEPIKGENDSETKGNGTSFRLTNMEEELNFWPLSQGEEDRPEAVGKAADSASEAQDDESAGTPAAEHDKKRPKVERIEPSYRLSDFDFLNLMSSPKQSEPAERKAVDPVRDDLGPSLDDVREAEEAAESFPEVNHETTNAPTHVEAVYDIQRPDAADGSSNQEEEAVPVISQETASPIEPSVAAVSDEAPVEQACEVDLAMPEEEIPQNGVEALYMRARSYLKDVRERLGRNEAIDVEPAVGIILRMINIHYEMDSEIYQLTVKFGHDEDYFFSHAVNTAIYSVKIGQRLGYSERSLLELGLAALLCDIGMFKIPADVLNKQGKLSSGEIDLIKNHPRLSQEALEPVEKEYPAVVDAIYKHQERENGQGYPNGLKGDEIPEYSKIIGICDSYEAMTHNRPHKKALMQTDSIRELIGSKNHLFSPKIVKAFLDEISIFPVGSYVRLNNRNIGRVVATNRSNPLKPTIKILCDENGKKFPEPRVIDLKANPILNIEGSISRDEVPV